MRDSRLKRTATRLLVAVAAASATLFAIEWFTVPEAERQAAAAPPPRPNPYPADYSTALANLDRALVTAQERAERMSDDWLAQEMLARAWYERGRLTGSYDDYAAAERALDRSDSVAPAGAGPHLLRASFEFGMHRLGPAAAALDRAAAGAVPASSSERAEIEAMRGDIAFYRGDVAGALRHYAGADAADPGATDFRRAVLHAFTGAPERARFYLDRAAHSGRPSSVQRDAWFELQRGILALERDQVAEAQAHFRRADGRFPGHWLVEEHLAETLVLTGNLKEAEARYRDIVARTGAPEFMDALADTARRSGDGEAARMWTERAAAEWRRRLAMFPEATFGHAFDHCRDKGDRACTLDLARRNYKARPYGEAQAMLALALREGGADAEAAAVTAAVRASPWRSSRTAELGINR